MLFIFKFCITEQLHINFFEKNISLTKTSVLGPSTAEEKEIH